jgi:hypothetical protein
MKAEQYQGKVKQYNADKGFGFISSPEWMMQLNMMLNGRNF